MAKNIQETKYTLLPKKRVKIGSMAKSRRLHQIQALRDIPRHGVKAGDLGGYVYDKDNLSQEGDCWVKERSVVVDGSYNHSMVSDNALIDGEYLIFGTKVRNNAIISGGKGQISHSTILNNTKIEGNVSIFRSDITGFSSIKATKPNPHQTVIGEFDIDIMYGVFNNLKLIGYGEINHVQSVELFEATGHFNLRYFIDSQKKSYTLTKPFEAHGNIEARSLEIVNSPVYLSGDVTMRSIYIGDCSVTINGGTIEQSQFKGIVDIAGKVSIDGSLLEGENYLRDTVNIFGAQLRGKNMLTGDTKVTSGSIIENQELSGGIADPINNQETLITSSSTDTPAIEATPAQPVAPVANKKEHVYREIIKTVEEDYEEYTTDIVKLIKYPAMADASVPETRELMIALRSARRVLKVNDTGSLEKTARDLEEAFVQAENKAYKLTATFLSDKEKAGLKRAGSAFAIALDENANEHERRAGYKSGMKSLEGVLPVNDKAVTVLKERIGLKEIEA